MSLGLVSVIVPAYNEEAFIAEALDSAFAQDYRPIEVIVVDDGSTDRTAEIALRYDVRLVRQPNRGAPAARNAGLDLARGEYIGILDADDIWPVGSVTALVSALERSGADIARGLLERFVTPGEPEPAHFQQADNEPVPGYVTLFARRSVYDAVGNFDESLPTGEDTDWAMRARDAGFTVAAVDEVITRYRMHPGNTSRDLEARRAMALRSFRDSIGRRRAGAEEPS